MIARALKNIFLENFTEAVNNITFESLPLVDKKQDNKVTYSDGDLTEDQRKSKTIL
jgi:hypothetical protein